MAAKASADVLFQFAKTRRSIYPLTKDIPIAASRVQEIVNEATLHTPSSFNSQSNRSVILLGAEHEKLWDLTSETLKAVMPAERWQQTADKLALFKGAAGTVLFFTDADVLKGFQTKFPPLADKFPGWANQSVAIQEYLVWTALELEGLGASLQHYTPAKLHETWGIPESWKLDAQIVFGGKKSEAGPKQFQPVEERVKVFGA